MDNNRQATLELGTKPVGKLLAQYALPAIIAMTAASLYNMVDSIFIGHGVGPMAISGLAITFPFMNLTAAFGAAVGIGASTYLSVKLGQKDYATAERTLGNNFTLNVVIGLAVGIVSLVFLDPILRFFGASDHTLPYARDFMQIILAANVISQMFYGHNAILRAVGKPKQAMLMTILTVTLNIILAPTFIWGLNLGIRGAALATVISQLVALLMQLHILSDKREPLHFHKGIFMPDSDIARNIISIGISPFSMNVCACVVVIFINNHLVEYGGDMAVGAYGIANRMAFIFVMINMGLNQGMQPIAGYNYGAQHLDRLMRVLKLSAIAATAIMTVGFAIAMILPEACARMFTSDESLVALSAHAISMIMMMFPIVGYQMVVTNFFQSIGKAKISIFLSLSRQLLFLLPLLFILSSTLGIEGVWAAMPASDAMAAVVATWMMMAYMKKFKKQNIETINGQTNG